MLSLACSQLQYNNNNNNKIYIHICIGWLLVAYVKILKKKRRRIRRNRSKQEQGKGRMRERERKGEKRTKKMKNIYILSKPNIYIGILHTYNNNQLFSNFSLVGNIKNCKMHKIFQRRRRQQQERQRRWRQSQENKQITQKLTSYLLCNFMMENHGDIVSCC